MHDLRGSVVLQQGSTKQARMLDVLAVLMQRNAEVRPARKGKRFCLESGSEKEAAARRMFRRCSPRKGMYYGTSSGRLAGCHAGPTRPPESAAEASTTYAAGEHLPRRGGGQTLIFFDSVAIDGDSWKAWARGSTRPTPPPPASSALAA